jgi:hypothetical protein
MSRIANSVVIREAASGPHFGHIPLQGHLEALAREGYRIVSVFPEGRNYVIIAQFEPRKEPLRSSDSGHWAEPLRDKLSREGRNQTV